MDNNLNKQSAGSARNPGTVDEGVRSAKDRYQALAIYHTCCSSAAWRMCDAVSEKSEAEALALRREAIAYDQCALWIQPLTK